jgi:hypothetical protein
VRDFSSSEPALRDILTRIERPSLASTAAKEITMMKREISSSEEFPMDAAISPTEISVIASRLRRVIKKCFRWIRKVTIAAEAIRAKIG